MTAVLAYTASTATRQGWDAVDGVLLSVLRRYPATLTDLVEDSGYSAPIVKDAILGYLQGGFAVRVTSPGYRYELTLAGHARLAQLAANTTVPAMRQAA